MPTPEEQLNKLLNKAAQQYKRINSEHVKFAIEELNRLETVLLSLILKYADKDSKIAVTRLSRLLEEVARLRMELVNKLTDALDTTIKESAEYGSKESAKALATAISAEAEEFNFDFINDTVFKYVVNRYGDDGLVLSDRVWRVSTEQYEAISGVLRAGIITGQSVGSMIKDIQKVYSTDKWKVTRLVVTEGNTAYRTASSYVAQESEHVTALRIHRGRANKPNHRCSQLEHVNRYGLGNGIFLPTDTEVLNPHPLCTSHTTYVIKEVNDGNVNA